MRTCYPVIVISKRIVVTRTNRGLLVRNGDHYYLGDQWIRNILNKIETRYKKIKLYLHTFSTKIQHVK